jgi:hypothetical protein
MASMEYCWHWCRRVEMHATDVGREFGRSKLDFDMDQARCKLLWLAITSEDVLELLRH